MIYHDYNFVITCIIINFISTRMYPIHYFYEGKVLFLKMDRILTKQYVLLRPSAKWVTSLQETKSQNKFDKTRQLENTICISQMSKHDSINMIEIWIEVSDLPCMLMQWKN